MTTQQRQQLLKCLEAYIEGYADDADVAELERLVQADAQCLQLFLRYMQLHGSLSWDAAGRGANWEELVPEEALSPAASRPSLQLMGTEPEPRRTLRQSWLVVSTAAALLLISLLAFRILPRGAEMPGDAEQSTASSTVNQVPSPEGHSENTAIVHVQLPQNEQQGEDQNSPRVQSDDSIPEPTVVALDVSNDSSVVALINEEVSRLWDEFQLQPSPPADDAEWVRRVYLDLAGRIPTRREVESFLTKTDDSKRETLVDTLLQSREFAANFATVWTNLLVGRSRDQLIDRGALHDYLESQFQSNIAWSETVADLITAEGFAVESGPANFLLAHLNNQAVPATAITTRILLCQQLQCSQCHRHPTVETWGQEKFWELNAFFQNTAIEQIPVVDETSGQRRMERRLVEIEAEQLQPAYYEDLRGVMRVAYPKYSDVEVSISPRVSLREQLAKLLTSGQDGQLAKAFVNRTWQQIFGYAFTRQVDDMGPHSEVSHPELLEGLGQAFVESGYDVRRLLRWICLSDVYHLSSASIAENQLDDPQSGELPLFTRKYETPLTPEQLFQSLQVAAGTRSAEELVSPAARQERDRWLQQFFQAIENEENSELSTFDGTLPQTLMMMNGTLVSNATDPRTSKVMHEILSQPRLTETERIEQLSLAALARYPTKPELDAIRKTLRQLVRQRTSRNVSVQVALNESLSDVYWAYLNSSEFSLNH